jgi:hypothetical protein
MTPISPTDAEEAISRAHAAWDENQGNLWALVRGKWVLPAFAESASQMRSGQGLLEAVARTRPHLVGTRDLNHKLDGALKSGAADAPGV